MDLQKPAAVVRRGDDSRIGQFLVNLVSEKPERRRSPGVAGFLCKKGIGKKDPSEDGWVVYESGDFARAVDFLEGKTQPVALPPPQPPVAPAAPPVASRAAAPVAVPDLWSRPDLVAVTTMNGGLQLPASGRYVVMDPQEAANIRHDVILLCQNMRELLRVSNYVWLEQFVQNRTTLVVYRGGVGLPGCTVASSDFLLRCSTAPVLALVDVDSTGLSVAARVPRLERLCVPSWNFVEQQMQPTCGERPARRSERLDGSLHDDVARGWRMLRTFPRGLSAAGFPAQSPDPVRLKVA